MPKLGNEFNGLKSLIIAEPEPDGAAAPGARKIFVVEDVPAGSVRLPVKDAAGFSPGEWLLLSLKSKDGAGGLLAGQTPSPSWTKLREGVSVLSVHQVQAVEDGALILADPVHVPLRAKDAPLLTSTRMLEEVGVEDLCFRGNWYGHFSHHQTALDDEAWDALRFFRVANGWVRRCSFLNVNTAVFLRTSANCSLFENRIAGTRGHYGITVRAGSCGVLNGLGEDLSGQAHGPSVGNQSANVVVPQLIWFSAPTKLAMWISEGWNKVAKPACIFLKYSITVQLAATPRKPVCQVCMCALTKPGMVMVPLAGSSTC